MTSFMLYVLPPDSAYSPLHRWLAWGMLKASPCLLESESQGQSCARLLETYCMVICGTEQASKTSGMQAQP